MIFDNLSRALKTQNWLAAGVEFVIVIAGVVIGFQINAWAEGRAQAEREAALLDRLHDEVEDAVGELRAMVEFYDTLNAQRTEAIERLIARDFENMDEDAMTSGAVSSGILPAFSASEGVYNEIVSAGMLSGLGDRAFREALGEYRSGVTFLRGQIDYFRDIANSNSAITETPHVSIVYAPGTARERRYAVDWEGAAADPEFMQLLLTGNNLIRGMTYWWEETLDEAEALCGHTARLTGRPCQPAQESVQ
ncbi:MAG: hypothetical protein RKE49_12310 [Oceanicaulis sp.]